MMISDTEKSSLVMAWVANLMFSPRVESAALGLAFDFKLIERAADLFGADMPGNRNTFLDKITQNAPVLIICDLENTEFPWEQWITWLQSNSSVSCIPVICFGSHKDVENLQKAKDVGADAVLARSRFFSSLPEMIKKYAH